MIKTQGKNIIMNQGDFGIKLPIIITNTLDTDKIEFVIVDWVEKKEVLKKQLPYENEKWIFELSKEDSEKLAIKKYYYSIKQYRNDILQNTINKDALFEVK